MEDGILAVVVDKGAVFDALVLLFEVGGKGWAVAATLEGVSLRAGIRISVIAYVGLRCD